MYSAEEERQVRKAFWQEFSFKSGHLRRKKGKPRQWLLHRSGIKGVQLKFVVTRQYAKVLLEINHKDEDIRLMLYEKFEQVRKVMEEITGSDLVWEPFDKDETGKEVCSISWQLDNVDFGRKSDWPGIMDFLTEKMLKLEEAYLEYRDFVKYFK